MITQAHQAWSATRADPLAARVVVLTNYLRPCHVSVMEALRQRVADLTILVSTPMEPDRDWKPQWNSLDVRVQKNWTWTRTWRHSSGFRESNFIHIPYDTLGQLRRLQPDIVFSTELGMRTLLASAYRWWRSTVPIVSICKMSEHIENERGWGRRALRSWLKRRVQYFTYNGPSCLRYLRSLGIGDERLFYYPYYYDEGKVYRGEKRFSSDGAVRILFVGNLTERKGVEPMCTALKRWVAHRPQQNLRLIVCGRGPLERELASLADSGIAVDLRGSCDDAQLREAYSEADLLWFPTLADEWGLVAIEAWGSGVPVLGSLYAQSIEDLGQEGVNGWFFRPDSLAEIDRALGQSLAVTAEQRLRMAPQCRQTIQRFTASFCAERLCDVLRVALPKLRQGDISPAARLFQVETGVPR